jgi:hypothetical protein
MTPQEQFQIYKEAYKKAGTTTTAKPAQTKPAVKPAQPKTAPKK